MNIRQLRNFVKVAELKHFRKAAAALGTSQPTLSQQIRALESELGVKLFERAGRSVCLSPIGERYRSEFIKALAILDGVECAAAPAAPAPLVIGATTLTVMSYLPDVLADFAARHPATRLELRVMSRPELLEALPAKAVDLGILRMPRHLPGVTAENLWEFPYRVVLPVHHPAARRPAIDLADLREERLIMYSRARSTDSYDQVVALCHALHFFPGAMEEVSDPSLTIGVVACGRGISIVPAPWERVLRADSVRFLPIAGADDWRYTMSACYCTATTAVRRFIDSARSVLQSDGSSSRAENARGSAPYFAAASMSG